ncbi:hypothetical protein ASB7_05300 [Helicobacter ailurogastricus]|nr:hypothetical protein ASB7_05300 [Helicobacter ailurogastricus]GLH57356.1 hypothetical protein NHP214376_01420 [Helicobacter ailurogastricus]GLH60188.1 hypothetical protein NHP214377_14640 [Helicobacter ailurogastricus]
MGLKSLKSLQNQIRSIEFKFVKTTFMAPPYESIFYAKSKKDYIVNKCWCKFVKV